MYPQCSPDAVIPQSRQQVHVSFGSSSATRQLGNIPYLASNQNSPRRRNCAMRGNESVRLRSSFSQVRSLQGFLACFTGAHFRSGCASPVLSPLVHRVPSFSNPQIECFNHSHQRQRGHGFRLAQTFVAVVLLHFYLVSCIVCRVFFILEIDCFN